MTRYGMLINTKKCVGCYACRMACQMINKLEPEEAFISYKEIEQGTYPSVYAETVPVQCMHCENAPCQQVCPTHATYTTDSGVVLVDEEKCIGCKYCMAACPYGVRIQIEKTGVIEKCRFCWYEGEPAIRRRAWEPAFRVRASSAIWTTRIARSTRLSRNTTHSRSLTT